MDKQTSVLKANVIDNEQQIIHKFLGAKCIINVPDLPISVTDEKLIKWAELGMGIHYLPDIDLLRTNDFPGWLIKPYEWFYERVLANDILDTDGFGKMIPVDKPLNLGGRWILIDERPKPPDQPGLVYENDFLGDELRRLREQGEIATSPELNPSTRFYISWKEWHDKLRPVVAMFLDVKTEQVRLPRVVEYSYLGNAIHPEWGLTDTWEWLQEACNGGKYRLRGGHSFAGGLAIVYWRTSTGHGTDRGFRPLVYLS